MSPSIAFAPSNSFAISESWGYRDATSSRICRMAHPATAQHSSGFVENAMVPIVVFQEPSSLYVDDFFLLLLRESFHEVLNSADLGLRRSFQINSHVIHSLVGRTCDVRKDTFSTIPVPVRICLCTIHCIVCFS